MSKRTIRCLSRTLILAVAVLVVGAGVAMAQHTTGVQITKTCPVFVNQGDTYNCTYSLQNQDVDHGVINLAVFDSHPPVACPSTQFTACAGEVQVACSGGLTATTLAAKNLAGDTCTGNLPDFTAPITCVTTDSETDVDNVRAVGNDTGVPALVITGSTQNGPVIAGLTCPPDTNECTNDICTVGVGCEHPPVADSTPCTDSDGNACTTAGCEAGACVQTHQTTVCNPDNNECTDDPACDPATGLCNHPPKSDSTPCSDSDGNACTTPGCETGVCVQTHQTTTCTPDNNECTSDPACDPATGLCNHPNVADSTPCTDTDNLSCTTAGCEAGSCVQTHISDCQNNEICRTPGFWGTHGGTEKTGSQNITGDVLGVFGGSLSICGVTIDTTAEALQAICVSPKGDSRLQLARQLTSAALNCGITDAASMCTGQSGALPCDGTSVQDVFNACNTACTNNEVSATIGSDTFSCIAAIDCFNNGGVFDTSDGSCNCPGGFDENGECANSCHSQPLTAEGCFDFVPPGPAGSPRACQEARKDCTTIFGSQCP
jgi:hypothetical protein